MKKIALTLIAATSLTACVEASDVAVSQNDTLTLTCADNPNMRTLNGLPMRCGPQSALPYTFQ